MAPTVKIVCRSVLKKSLSCPTIAHKVHRVRKSSVGDHVEDDVMFLVGPAKAQFQAKPSKLAAASPVFRAMLLGHFERTTIINIVDVTPAAFELLLKSINEGVLSIKVGSLNMEVALDTFYAAHKYGLSTLEACLLKFIQRDVNVDNALQVLHHAEFYGLVPLQSKCWSIIETKASRVIRSEQFPFVSWNILCGILENGRLKIKEYDLFEGAIRWCGMEARRDINKGKRFQEIIGVAIYKIRFPLMSDGEFNSVVRTGILNKGEIADLRSNFRRNKTFCHVPRTNWCDCRKNRRSCPLCNCHHDSFLPVDGLVNYNTLAKDQSLSSSNNSCECLKYYSCPAYPNGSTGLIMQRLKLV